MDAFSALTWSKTPSTWLVRTGIFEIALAVGFAGVAIVVDEVRIGFLITAAAMGLVGSWLFRMGVKARARYDDAQRVRTTGVRGVATITSMGQRMVHMSGSPLAELELMVRVADRPPYPMRHREFIPQIMLGRLTSGEPLPVRVDRADPYKVVIDWKMDTTGGS
jgi:hypothetical protein